MGSGSSNADRAGAADLGLLVLRLTVGGLLAGHGAQKLFGWFGGGGLAGTGAWLESIDYRPGKTWALLAGLSEFGGGTLTALGLLHPLGPISTLGAMVIAAVDVHGGKPIWVTEGGAEVPVINMSAATALILAGPGTFSMDRALGVRLPRSIAALVALGVVTGVAIAETRPRPTASDTDATSTREPESAAGGTTSGT